MKNVVVAISFVFLACRSAHDVSTRHVECPGFEVVVVQTVLHVRVVHGVISTSYDQLPIAGVELMLRELGGTAIVACTKSDERGAFAFPAIRGGWYQLETCLEGFNATVMPVQVSTFAPNKEVHVIISIAE